MELRNNGLRLPPPWITPAAGKPDREVQKVIIVQRGRVAAAGIVTSGLVLYLDAGSSSSYPGSGTAWTDLSGSGANGTLVNGPTYNSSSGGYIALDGTNDRVDCGTGLAQAASWTISAAFRITGGTDDRVIMARSNGSPTYTQNYVLVFHATNKVGVSSSVDNYKRILGSTTIANNTWCVATGTYEASTKTLTIYVNATAEGSTTITANPSAAGTQYVHLGCVNGLEPGFFLNGQIAQALIYNRVLSGSEISTNFEAVRGRLGI